MEIYEGDVVNDEWREENGTITYDDGSFVVTFSNVQEYLSECAESIEVIGNIYENPDLLP